MNLAAVVLALALPFSSAQAFDLSDLFKPRKKAVQKSVAHPKKKPVKKEEEARPTSSDPAPIRRNGKLVFKVDNQWMASYRVVEAVWEYAIPEDDQIEYDNGVYYVPVVVYRHYQDMIKTPKKYESSSR